MGIMDHRVEFEGKRRVLRVAYSSSGSHTDFSYNDEEELRKLAAEGGGPKVNEMNFAVVYAKWPSDSAISHVDEWYIENRKAERLVKKLFPIAVSVPLTPAINSVKQTENISSEQISPKVDPKEYIFSVRYDGENLVFNQSEKKRIERPVTAFLFKDRVMVKKRNTKYPGEYEDRSKNEVIALARTNDADFIAIGKGRSAVKGFYYFFNAKGNVPSELFSFSLKSLEDKVSS